MKLSVIIPCYNEEAVIETTYTRVYNVMIENEYNYEIVFVNDGSKDTTMQKLRKIAAADKQVKVISFSRNFGHQPAVSAGILTAQVILQLLLMLIYRIHLSCFLR